MKTKEEVVVYQQEYQKKYRKENKEKISSYIKKWRKKNLDTVKTIAKKYRDKNKDKTREYGKKRRQTIKGKYSRYKSSAKKRNKYFNLTIEQFEFIISGKCYYCGDNEKIGIDRKDNNIGYVLENCVPCCWPCNKFKRCVNFEHFIFMCKKISKYQFSRDK